MKWGNAQKGRRPLPGHAVTPEQRLAIIVMVTRWWTNSWSAEQRFACRLEHTPWTHSYHEEAWDWGTWWKSLTFWQREESSVLFGFWGGKKGKVNLSTAITGRRIKVWSSSERCDIYLTDPQTWQSFWDACPPFSNINPFRTQAQRVKCRNSSQQLWVSKLHREWGLCSLQCPHSLQEQVTLFPPTQLIRPRVNTGSRRADQILSCKHLHSYSGGYGVMRGQHWLCSGIQTLRLRAPLKDTTAWVSRTEKTGHLGQPKWSKCTDKSSWNHRKTRTLRE